MTDDSIPVGELRELADEVLTEGKEKYDNPQNKLGHNRFMGKGMLKAGAKLESLIEDHTND